MLLRASRQATASAKDGLYEPNIGKTGETGKTVTADHCAGTANSSRHAVTLLSRTPPPPRRAPDPCINLQCGIPMLDMQTLLVGWRCATQRA